MAPPRKRVTVICRLCGTPKEFKACELKRGGVFCSRDCYFASKAAPRVGSKECRRCHAEKPVEEFPQRTGRPEGERGPYCVPCVGIIGKPGRIRYAKTAKGIAAARRSQNSETVKASHRAAVLRRMADGRDGAYHRRWIKNNPGHYLPRHAARQRLRTAIKNGTVIRPAACGKCAAPCTPHGHHHNGYDGKNALDVMWLCRRCHDAEHQVTSSPTFVPVH